MGTINLGRVILGGLAAGIVIDIIEGVMNGVVFAKQWSEVMTGLGKSATLSTSGIIAFNIWGFAAGISLVWLYAAMRPRFGAGPRTAICAGLIVWFLADALGVARPVILNIFRIDFAAQALAIQLVEMILAGLAGAYLYKEEAVGTLKSSSARA
jgi:hypothetical protein